MKEAHSLIDRARRYVASAELLLREGDYESSVSRAYYAMFFCAEAVLLTEGMSFSSHKGVISAFGQHFVKTGVFSRELGRELNRAFDLRQIADYEFSFVIGEARAAESVTQCSRFLSSISDYLRDKDIL